MKIKFLSCFLALVLLLSNVSLSGKSASKTADEFVIPPLLSAASESESLPEAYCMRDDYIVLAQNQDAHGYCWNFSATMSASTTIMKATGEYYDFSELWMGVSAYMAGGYNKIGMGAGFGTQKKAMQYAGLMLEVDLPYQSSYTVSNENVADYYNFYNRYANDDIAGCLVSDSSTSFKASQVEEIKSHVYNHGSVCLSFSFRKGFVESGEAYYLPPDQQNTTSSHAISVIGWDDNYTKELYVDGSDTPKVYQGAWIVLNSYTETNSKEGVAFIFYEDANITSFSGYRYQANTEKDFYFYDKIESGYAYPTGVKGKYYGDFVAKQGETKQKNIFYDDVDLTYSYLASDGVSIAAIEIYLGSRNVTDEFDVRIFEAEKRFSISADGADYGQYKVLVTYTDGEETDTYLNNFFVTYGLVGEGVEFDNEKNELAFRTGRDLEFYGFTAPDKNYVIYTDKLSGTLSFVPLNQSVYSEKNMSIPPLSYEITDGKSDTVIYTVTSETGYSLDYVFRFEYCEDTTLQPVNVYYDLGGGTNHTQNYSVELASDTTDLLLYEPQRPGYTFAGWYLDYGNGSKKLAEQDGVYYIDWDDIHHMGESPSLNAISHYKKYYSNANTVFVYARWEEVEYYDVQVTIVGEGKTQIANKISVSADEVLNYVFKFGSEHCISSLEINGGRVTDSDLVTIADRGLRFENIDREISVTVTISEGTYLMINVGENIKSAYIKRAESGKTVKYYSGQCVPNLSTRPGSVGGFTLTVEVRDDENGYTYLFEDADLYNFVSKGTFAKNVFILKKNGVMQVTVGSAIAKPILPVTLQYSVNEHVTEHYISSNPRATKGDEDLTYLSGECVYLFIKTPLDTAEYSYSVPDGFESVGRNLYRRRLFVDPDAANLGVINVVQERNTYTVTWEDWDGSILGTKDYYYGDAPAFGSTPTRADEAGIGYAFTGWSPAVSAVTSDVTYTAEYSSFVREYTVTAEASVGGSVSCSESGNTLTFADSRTYTFTAEEGYRLKDVTVNGASVGALATYTLSEVCSDQVIYATFEKLTLSVSVSCGENGAADPSGTFSVAYGSELAVNVSPSEGYTVDFIKINGEAVTPTQTLKISHIKEDTVIEIGFKELLSAKENEGDVAGNQPGEDNAVLPIILVAAASTLTVAASFAAVVIVKRSRRRKNKDFDDPSES